MLFAGLCHKPMDVSVLPTAWIGAVNEKLSKLYVLALLTSDTTARETKLGNKI